MSNVDIVQFLGSQLLEDAGIAHGWFMRYGGVSTDLFSSLNGKKGNGDEVGNVNENRRRAHRTLLGSQAEYKDLTHIVHSFETHILEATRSGEFANFDASITSEQAITLSQTTADCGTVIIADSTGSSVALVHGSWHTLKEEIICKTVAKLKTHTQSDFVAGIGPMICKNCYEFGPEAADLFEPQYVTAHQEKFLVDLKLMITDQLYKSGVNQVDDLNICTKEDQRFFSHRRSGAHSGRFLTLAAIK